jgi:hypothetical protein
MEPPDFGLFFPAWCRGGYFQKVPLGENVMAECPYYKGEYKQCNLTGTTQNNDNNREMYCRSDGKWKRCANYEGASYDYKKSKALRPNPDL